MTVNDKEELSPRGAAVRVRKATPAEAIAIKARRGVLVRSSEGRLAPPESQRAIAAIVIAAITPSPSAPPRRTRTFTYTVTEFANPFLVCDDCRKPVRGYINAPDTGLDRTNDPCRHVGVTSLCPSWSPVDGCCCVEYLQSALPCTEPPQ